MVASSVLPVPGTGDYYTTYYNEAIRALMSNVWRTNGGAGGTFDMDVEFAVVHRFSFTAPATRTFTVSNAADGRRLQILIVTGSAGTYVTNWPADFQWIGSAPVLAAGTTYVFDLRYDSTLAKWVEVGRSRYSAADIPNTPAGNISATTVQAAIDELDAEKQPLDSDLTTIAGLTPTTDNIMQAKAGAWASRTLAQLWADLKDLTVTLTNKTISLGSNTISGTLAQFNTAVTDADLASLAGAETLTNKRITRRVSSTADTATLTVDSDSYDGAKVTALAQALTVAAPTGTPTAMQPLIIRIKDNGTARALTWNAAFRAIGVTLPTTTVISKTVYVGCMWNAEDSKWDAVAVAQEA